MSFGVRVLCVGRKSSPWDKITDHYARLIRPLARVEVEFVRPVRLCPPNPGLIAEKESTRLQSRWKKTEYPVSLSSEGTQRDSREFAQWLRAHQRASRTVVFGIGGAYGLSTEVKRASREIISLSPMTLAHELCLAVLVEQLYRAFTILTNHPYHK